MMSNYSVLLVLKETLSLLNNVKKENPSRQLSLSITKLEESILWFREHVDNG